MNNKIYVNVYQKRGNEKAELVNVWEDEKQNIKQLLAFLYRKTIQQSKNLTFQYSYDYNDYQKLTIIEKYENYDGSITKTYYEFHNIPTNLGFLDIYKINI